MKRFCILLCVTFLLFSCFFCLNQKVYADELGDNINEQIKVLDLSEIEKIFNENIQDESFNETLYAIIDGKYTNINDYFNLILNVLFESANKILPFIITIILLCLILSILDSFYDNDNGQVKKLVNFISYFGLIILFSTSVISVFKNSISFLKTLSKINEAVSPILLTILSATGGSVSAGIYNPSTVFISLFINNIVIRILVPIVILIFIISIINSADISFNLKGYENFFSSIFKWIIGIVSLLFTIILSISGISSGIRDGLSFKATKYALSNTIPIIGGIIKDGFDFVLASGIILKNAIGFISIILIVFMVLKEIVPLILMSISLKAANAIINQLSFTKINSFCSALSTTITYIISLIVVCSLMLIIYLFLIISSANVLF